MLSLTLKDLVEAYGGLRGLLQVQAPVKTALYLRRLAMKLEPEVRAFEEVRMQLLRSVGTPVEGTGQYTIPPSKVEWFNEQLESALSEVREVDMDKLSASAFGPDAKVAGADLLACHRFIEE